MDAQLLIRPGPNDHKVIESLLAPGGSGIFKSRRPLIGQLVADATVASLRPMLAETAAGAGIPYLVDPLTPLLQGELAPDDRWVKLPYGKAQALSPDDLRSRSARADLIERVVKFQVELGATAVIPPYTYARAPSDPWFTLSVELITETARFMAQIGVRLPLIPILCGQLQHFGLPERWPDGVRRFAEAAGSVEPQFVGVCLSPAGAADESYGKVQRLFATALRLRAEGMRVVAWRQGIYGPGLVAAGLDGYETGIGSRERTDIAASISQRKPGSRDPKRKRGANQGLLLLPLGRSLSVPVAKKLLEDLPTRANIVCDDEQCCPDGVRSMVQTYREHTIRSRARYMAELADMPMPDWRLFKIGRDAREAVTLIAQANQVLARDDEPGPSLSSGSMASLAQVADHLLEERIRRGA